MVISAFLLVTAVFIPIGVASLLAFNNVVEIVGRYDSECIPPGSRNDKVKFIQGPDSKICTRNLTVPKDIKKPIYVYYQHDNFYQNHRRYVKIRSDTQLRSAKSEDDTDACKPENKANNQNNCAMWSYCLELV